MVKKSALDVRNFLERFDIFGKPLPGFNIKGRQQVNTMFGGASRLLLLMIVMLYAATKLIHLMSKANPNVSSYIREGSFTEEDILNLNQMNFKIAFAVEGFVTKDLKYDPRYVKWIFRMYGKKNDEQFERILNHHICTDEDYAEFSPIA